MFDTIVGSVWSTPDQVEFEADLINGLNEEYICQRIYIPFSKAIINNHAYQILLKFQNKKHLKKYFLVKMKPRCDLVGVPALKIKSEISNFRNAESFLEDFFSLSKSKAWEFILANHHLSCIHPKCDFSHVSFEDFRLCLDHPHSRKPGLVTNINSGSRTLYVSPNHYYYEKDGFVRGELRLGSNTVIMQKLGICRFSEIQHVPIERYVKLFSPLSFRFPFRLVRAISEKDYGHYRHFLACLNNQSHFIQRSRKGNFQVSFNCFLSAKKLASNFSNRSFNRNVLSAMPVKEVWLKADLINEHHNFNRSIKC